MLKLIYPARFIPNGNGYTVDVLDMPGCVTEGATFAEALEMAVDAASGWILEALESGEELPKATMDINAVEYEQGTIVNFLVLDMDAFSEKYGNTAVRKNLTIPAWLNTAAERNNINFSQVLQQALAQKLNLTPRI